MERTNPNNNCSIPGREAPAGGFTGGKGNVCPLSLWEGGRASNGHPCFCDGSLAGAAARAAGEGSAALHGWEPVARVAAGPTSHSTPPSCPTWKGCITGERRLTRCSFWGVPGQCHLGTAPVPVGTADRWLWRRLTALGVTFAWMQAQACHCLSQGPQDGSLSHHKKQS